MRFLQTVSSAVVFVVLCGTCHAKPLFPPPGQMVDIGGYRVHLNCIGTGSPTVMILGAGYSVDWALVQPEVGKFSRVCTWDPPGSAWSDPGPMPTCEGRVEEIHTVLKNAGIADPLVVVGHSIGAVFARMYASRYPLEVRGMVMVDHAGWYGIDRQLKLLSALEQQRVPVPDFLVLAPIGQGRPNTVVSMPAEQRSLRYLPPLERDIHVWAASLPRPSSLPFYNRCMAEAARNTGLGPGALGDMPLIVIANQMLAESASYQQFQAALLDLSRDSEAVVSASRGHAVPLESPGTIVDAVRRVVAALREQRSLR